MIVALNIAVFAMGFLAALVVVHRKYLEQDESGKFSSQIRQMIQRFVADQPSSTIKKILEPVDELSLGKNGGYLLTKEDIERQYDLDTWQRLAYEDFKTKIMAKGAGSKTFPCVYATMGYRSNDHRYVFLESDNPAEPRNLRRIAPALKEYLQTAKSLGPNTSIVIIGAPSESHKSVVDYTDNFWEMLRGLRIKDHQPWPSEIPQHTESEKWTFCFDGQPLFPVMLTPAHQRRWSRNMPVPIIAMQPKWVLDNLLSTSERRESATSKVRKLLADYDQIDISPDLTSYGQPGTSEIHQLCLLDENETSQCPYEDFDK